MLQALDAVGLKIANHWVGAKVCAKAPHPLGHKMNNHPYEYTTPNIDLFLSKRTTVNGKAAYAFLNKKAQDMWPNYVHMEDDVLDKDGKINQRQFGPIKLNTLQNPRAYCLRYYGQNVFSEAYVQYDHLKEQSLRKTPTILTDFRAPYFKEWDQLSKITPINK